MQMETLEARKVADMAEQDGKRFGFIFGNSNGVTVKVVPATIGIYHFWTVVVSNPAEYEGRELVEGRALPIFFNCVSASSAARKLLDNFDEVAGGDHV